MVAVVKIRSKGTSINQSISSVYTAIPGIISIDKTGEKNVTYDSTTIDGATAKTKANAGYTEPPEIGFDFFYDPTHASHIALKTLMRTPSTTIPAGNVEAGTLFKFIYTDTGPLDEIWNVVGVGVDEKFAQNDGVKSSCKLECSGATVP